MRTSGIAILLGFLLAVLCGPLAAQTNPIPHVNNPLVPAAALPGSPGLTLTVNGADFVAGSVVKWNGSARATTFVSPTKVTAAIQATDVATSATVFVTVSNPSPGGGTSNSVFFEVTTPTTSLAFTRTDSDLPFGGLSTIEMPTALTVLDLKNTGAPYLAIANQKGPISITGDGSVLAYQASAGASPHAIGSGDFNGDGLLDLITVGASNFSILLNMANTGSEFPQHNDYPLPSGAGTVLSVALGDFNGDGHLDLALAGNAGVYVLLGNGDGTFGSSAFFNTSASSVTTQVAAGDFNGDGKLDLAVSNISGGTVSILMGNGDGTFQLPVDYQVGSFPNAILTADFNGDGKLDLAVVNDTTLSILLGNGNGTFQPKVDYPAGTSIMDMTVGDYNGDGVLDLAVSDSQCVGSTCPTVGSVNVLLGNGDGTFQSHLAFAAGSVPLSIATGEFGDAGLVGRSGFATANYQGNTVSIFTPISTVTVNSVPTVSSISPTSVQIGSGALTLAVNGTNFVNGAEVFFGATSRPTTFVSSTQLTASIFATDVASAGVFGVSVSNPAPGGGSSTSIIFNVFLPPPVISSLSPPSVVAGGPAFTLAVNGSNFVNGATVNVNGLPRTAAFVSVTQVTVPISASEIANQGTIGISVTVPQGSGSAGGTSSTLTLAILPANTQPVVGALIPASITAGGPPFTLLLTGTGFTSGSVVTFNAKAVSSAFKDSTQLQAAIPASAIAVAGTPFVTVTNPGGNPSLVTTFTVNNPVPTASSLSPSTVALGNAAITLNVIGTNFNTSSLVLVNGSSRATTFSSSTLLTAALPASDFVHGGTLSVTVSNPIPGGGTTSALTIVVGEDFKVSVAAPSASVVAGNPASYSLLVTPLNVTTANSVMFTISGLPTGAAATFSPSAIPAGSGATTVTLSITTLARSAVPPTKSPRLPSPLWPGLYLTGLAIAFMWLGLRVLSGSVPRLATQFLLVSLVVFALVLVACGGVTGPAARVNLATGGTPVGTYPIVVTATSGSVSLSTTVSLTVQ